MVEMHEFEAVYLTGAGVSYSTLGQPDVGLITLPEMCKRLEMMSETVNIPIIADGDTGNGNAMNTMRTVRKYERAGEHADWR